MNFKTAFSIALLSIIPNYGNKVPNVNRSITTLSKTVLLTPEVLKSNITDAKDRFYKTHPQYKPDTIVGNATADYLAEIAKKYGSNKAHTCWHYGKKPQRYGLGVELGGGSAYMAAKEHEKAIDTLSGKPYYLKITDPNSPVYKNNEVVLGIMGLNKLYMEHPDNMEIKREFQRALREGLPKGVSLVWDKLRRVNPKTGKPIRYTTGDWKQHGHYGITIGNGKERSWKTMNIAVFPTKLDMYIPNFFPSDYNLDVPQNIAKVTDTLAEEAEEQANKVVFLSKTTRAYMKR